MGVSTNGIIAFGVVCDEDQELPWDVDEFDGDIDRWWCHVGGYVPIHEPFTKAGSWSDGWAEGDPRLKEFDEQRRVWDTANPVPVELENYCSGDCPMYAITVPGVGLSCRRGYPESIDLTKLVVTDKQTKDLLDFLAKHKIKFDGNPGWLLMSYWG